MKDSNWFDHFLVLRMCSLLKFFIISYVLMANKIV
jgi:hypothetical protein